MPSDFLLPQGAEGAVKDGDSEEVVNSPRFVPTVGQFFQHDTREGEEGSEETAE